MDLYKKLANHIDDKYKIIRTTMVTFRFNEMGEGKVGLRKIK